VNAPSPAVAAAQQLKIEAQQPKVIVRLADPAFAAAYASVAFGLLLIFSPVSFPRMIVQNWYNGRLTIAIAVFAVLFDLALYLHVGHLLSVKFQIIAPACLGSLPIMIVVGLNYFLQVAISLTVSADLPRIEARINEEILTYTYFQLVSAIFIPFLLLRLLGQFKARKSKA